MSKLLFVTMGIYPSSRIRAEQVAKKLGAEVGIHLNGYDKIVFVKCWPDNIEFLYNFEVGKVYIDLIDSDAHLPIIGQFPQVKVIAISEEAKKYVSRRIPNPVYVIPEHHCNFENFLRSRKEVKVVGYVGSRHCLDLDEIELKTKLARHELKFKCLFVDTLDVTRKDIVEFYKSIDIQVSFRGPRLVGNMPPEMKNALKLCNAGSFKIPTIGYPEFCWEDFKDCYVEANTLDDVVKGCRELKDDSSLYDLVAKSMYDKAQDYHLDKIAKIYTKVLNEN